MGRHRSAHLLCVPIWIAPFGTDDRGEEEVGLTSIRPDNSERACTDFLVYLQIGR